MRTVRLRRPARGEGLLVGLALAAGATFAVGVVGAADAASRSADCAPVVASQSDDWDAVGNAGELSALRGMGWRGIPTDGLEALYPPGCLTLP